MLSHMLHPMVSLLAFSSMEESLILYDFRLFYETERRYGEQTVQRQAVWTSKSGENTRSCGSL
jgi:glucan phosphorylase